MCTGHEGPRYGLGSYSQGPVPSLWRPDGGGGRGPCTQPLRNARRGPGYTPKAGAPQVLGPPPTRRALEAPPPPAILGPRSPGPDPRRAWRDLRPRAAPLAPRTPEARVYLSPACRQYATMMSRGLARRVESRGRLKVGSAHGPAAGRSALGTGRGGTPDLPISPPLAPPGLPSSPCCPAAESPPTPGANGGGRPGPRVPIPGRAGRPRPPIGSADASSVCLAGFRSTPAGPRGPRGPRGPAPGRGPPSAWGHGRTPASAWSTSPPSSGDRWAKGNPTRTARRPPGPPATGDGLG